ncbi:MAG: proteasome accessory factor PafA2 [Actinobacteria bacterium]|nr:proteasome accessory factor PafA2 [Actinomycetota bacterium]
MAVAKVCGIETEYGIVLRGAGESNPVTASSMLINAYVAGLAAAASGTPKVAWDFEDESPGNDARGFSADDSMAPEVDTHLVNAVLTSGARFYVDHAHPELSTPECRDARQAVVWDRAGEVVMTRAMEAAKRMLPPGQEVVVHKNNSDGKGNSYGCHENYLMDRAVPFHRIVVHATAHFVTRQVFCGAGKVGSEVPGTSGADVHYQLSQRADFFEAEVGLETTLKRPIVNTRDEPHADPQKYRRLHVIVGDANLCEVATFLKVGTTAIVLAMVEDDQLPRDFLFRSPVQAMRAVSTDLTLRRPIELVDGTTVTALGVQWELLERARKYADERGLEAVGEDVGAQVLRRWEEVLTGLETDPTSVAGQVDWVAKKGLIDAWVQRQGAEPSDPRVAALALQYHDLRPERCLARRVGLERLVDDAEVEWAVDSPPPDTRAYFRGRCLQRFARSIVAANWDSIVFDVGRESLRRVPMMEPTRGTRAHVGRLLDECDTPAELLDRLGS